MSIGVCYSLGPSHSDGDFVVFASNRGLEPGSLICLRPA
jgi:hypothetical protein